MFSERIKNISESPTIKIAAKAIQMKRQKIDVVDLSVGEPDFPTPQNVKEAGKSAIDNNLTKYTLNKGITELRQAIVQKLKQDNNLDYHPDEVIVSNGAKQAIINVLMTIVGKDDEVIIPSPYWVSYPEMVTIAEGKPVIIQTSEENGFKLTPRQLNDAISANTRALILCNPSNPTGAVYSKEELEALAEIIGSENLYVVADEIYEKLVYDNTQFVSFAAISPSMKKQTVVVNGVSKAYAMTGWRIGYAAAERDIIDGAGTIQSHMTSNASSISQYASLEALSGPQYEISKMRAEFEKRRNYVHYKLTSIAGISCPKPEGAFYAFANIASYFNKEYKGIHIRNSYGLAYYLLKEAKVVIIPGAAFGADNYIRISYATSMERLEEGMRRIQEALKKLKTPAKVRSVTLDNTRTRVKEKVAVESTISIEKRDALVAEAEAQLKYDNYYEWNANINGVVIQLRTNHAHLYNFWLENWYPAQIEADLEPHGIIYAIDGAVGRQAHSFYSSETKTGVLFNTDNYGSLRRLALGMVTDIAERVFEMHSLRAMTADMNGIGFALIGAKGTKKTDVFYSLLNHQDIAFHSNDFVFVRYGGGYAAADLCERKVYTPTHTVLFLEQLAKLFERSKCENVVSKSEDCQHQTCDLKDECLLDKGHPYCFYASKNSFALLDPYWLGGMQKHVKRIDIRNIFILKNDPIGEIIKPLSAEQSIQILESGSQSGAGPEPFFNPHLLIHTPERIELQRRFFNKMLQSVRCYLLNVGKVEIQAINEVILEAIKND